MVGSLKERDNKTLTYQSPYGGGQVLNIDTKKNEVTFVAHRGFAPDGSTIYYIATERISEERGRRIRSGIREQDRFRIEEWSVIEIYLSSLMESKALVQWDIRQVSLQLMRERKHTVHYGEYRQLLGGKNPSQAQFLTTAKEISTAGSGGKLTVDIAGVIVNCPFVEVPSNS